VRCARLFIYWRAGAVTIWVPRFRRCCATRTASGATASTEYSGDSDAQLGLINVLYHWASDGMNVLRADLFNLEPGVIDAVRASPLGELVRPENLVSHTRGQTGPKTPTNMPTKGLSTNSSAPPPSLPRNAAAHTSAHLKF
jgi:hypothetical protein